MTHDPCTNYEIYVKSEVSAELFIYHNLQTKGLQIFLICQWVSAYQLVWIQSD